MNEIILPELGEDIEKAVIACWHKAAGDVVSDDDDICEVVTDKATFNVTCGYNGTLRETRFRDQGTVGVRRDTQERSKRPRIPTPLPRSSSSQSSISPVDLGRES